MSPRRGLLALLPKPWWVVANGVLLVALFYVVPFDDDRSLLFRALGSAVVLVALAVVVLRGLRRHADPVGRSVTTLLLVIISFSAIFYGLSRIEGQFAGVHTRTDALYFTVVTMATIGYGDIHPTGQAARVVTVLAVVFNLIFVAALVSTIAARLRDARPGPESRLER